MLGLRDTMCPTVKIVSRPMRVGEMALRTLYTLLELANKLAAKTIHCLFSDSLFNVTTEYIAFRSRASTNKVLSVGPFTNGGFKPVYFTSKRLERIRLTTA